MVPWYGVALMITLVGFGACTVSYKMMQGFVATTTKPQSAARENPY